MTEEQTAEKLDIRVAEQFEKEHQKSNSMNAEGVMVNSQLSVLFWAFADKR